MSATSEVSAILGRYMLLGWTLTDVNCRKPNCIGCPLMRSKDGVEFCARCDGGPRESSLEIGTGLSSDRSRVNSSRTSSPPSSSDVTTHSESGTARHHQSGFSTPPTPALVNTRTQNRFGIDDDDDENLEDEEPWIRAPIADQQTLEARRTQSDLASSRIGNLLLKGWVLLNGQCQGDSCWGVPLMRTPKNTNQNDLKRKWCVICEHDWESDESFSKRERADEIDSSQGTTRLDEIFSSNAKSSNQSNANEAVETRASQANRPVEKSQQPRPSPSKSNRVTRWSFISGMEHEEQERLKVVETSGVSRTESFSSSRITEIARDSLAESIKHLSRNLVSDAKSAAPDLSRIVSTAESLQKLLAVHKSL